jgi:hypothetical protein
MQIIEISIYFIREYPLSYPLHVRGGFYPQISAGTDIFVIPISNIGTPPFEMHY